MKLRDLSSALADLKPFFCAFFSASFFSCAGRPLAQPSASGQQATGSLTGASLPSLAAHAGLSHLNTD